MNKQNGKIVRVTISEDAYYEYEILSNRSKKGGNKGQTAHEIMSEVLEKYIDKKKDKTTISE